MLHLVHYQLPFVVTLLILLLSAKMLGELFERYGQPSMIGELLAGIILGPSVFNIIPQTGELKVIADLGVFFLIVMAGLEIDVEEIRNSFRGRQVWIALGGFIIPFISGFLIGTGFNFSYTFTIFLALSIAITALPVTIRILLDLGKLNSDIGRRIISSAIFNDIISLLILGIILDFNETSGSLKSLTIAVAITLIKVTCFIVILMITYRLFLFVKARFQLLNPKVDKFLHFFHGKESLFALVLLFVLLFSSMSELMGLHFVVGAFFGAILIPRSLFDPDELSRVKTGMTSITSGFLAPVFFATMGIAFDLLAINNLLLLTVILIAAFMSKLLGGYLGGKLAGLDNASSITIGIGLNARGIMELVIANLAYSMGFIDISIFSILVLMAILTTLITPFLLKDAFTRIEKSNTT